ncbi:MAG: AraC family transcriptional regulator [Victivallales bacterium]|jgi:AraC-like DNA-binding protein|nr:AraC family transcriptional regulator [Victivallales bacterium]
MELKEVLRMYEKHLFCSISLEPLHRGFLLWESLKLTADQTLHHSDFCRHAKLRDNNRICAANKQRSLEIARYGHSFYGRCPNGVWEYVRPVHHDRAIVAILYIGGGATNREQLCAIRKTADFIEEFIRLELTFFMRSGIGEDKRKDEAFYLECCRDFLESHALNDVTLSDLAELIGITPNYLSSLLKRKNDMSFRQLLTKKRLQQATVFLKLHKTMPVTEVASRCGFCDPNYFSTVFRKHFGQSPREYRKNISANSKIQ